ncbi:MAG: response regulator [Opitutales bacterium]|nr:response regulator [Opitutales bacterium]
MKTPTPRDALAVEGGRSVLRGLLWPLTFLLGALVFLGWGLLWWQHRAFVQSHIDRGNDFLYAEIDHLLEIQAHGMRRSLEIFALDPDVLRFLIAGNRDVLLRDWLPFFEAQRAGGELSHLYFFETDGTVLLRLHDPDRFGDPVTRFLIERAIKTGESGYGLELGMNGLLVLRAVMPVKDGEGNLLGLVEMGNTLAHVLARQSRPADTHLIVLVHKALVDRLRWEASPEGRMPGFSWEQMPSSLAVYSSFGYIPEAFLIAADHDPLRAHVHGDGGNSILYKERTWRLTAETLFDASGEPVGCILGILDVTDLIGDFRRLSVVGGGIAFALLAGLVFGLFSLLRRTGDVLDAQERSIVDAARRREEAEALFRGLFDNSPVPIFLIEPERKEIVRSNPQTWKSYGFESFEELVSNDFWMGPPYSEKDMREWVDRSMREGPQRFEWCNRHRNGSLFWEEVYMKPILVGERYLTLATCVDVTARKEAEEGLLALNSELEQTVRQSRLLAMQAQAADIAKTEFLANLSHELRTPMNGILGMTDLVLEDELSASVRESLEIIRQSGDRMMELVDQLLALADFETGRGEIVEEDFSLRDLIRDEMKRLILRGREKGLTVRFRILPNTPDHLHSDPRQINRVLRCFTDNALKFTPAGHVRLRIEGLKREGRVFIRAEIHDTGPGLPENFSGRGTEKFWQGDTSLSREYEGLGLGLPVASSIVTLLGGRIGFEGRPGGGTIAWFEIPVEAAVETTDTEADESPDLARVDTPHPRVLIVEDNESNRLINVRAVTRVGLESLCVQSGDEALEKLRKQTFALVLMDVRLPGPDGIEVTRQLRASTGWATRADVPVMAVTAQAFAADREKCMEVGMNDFLAKPLALETLQQKIRDLVGLPEDFSA